LPYGPAEIPPDLAAVVTAWPSLPEPIRAGILAMIRAAAPVPNPSPVPHTSRRSGGRRPREGDHD
jgi:hypothetical protein